jgi:SAM-dependent methyltransferase
MRSEPIVRALHEARPGATSKAFARAGSYERLWARVHGTRILDLACGDRPMPGAIGIDLVRERGIAVQGRVQQLPFRDGAFDAALCHLAFMLFDDIETVVGELHRVLAPGATFHALLGGGPVADGEDAFHAFARLMPTSPPMGDPRSKRPEGWREIFQGWSEPTFERWELDLSGSFDDVWLFLGASYSLTDEARVQHALRAAFPTDPVPCRVACYYASVTR